MLAVACHSKSECKTTSSFHCNLKVHTETNTVPRFLADDPRDFTEGHARLAREGRERRAGPGRRALAPGPGGRGLGVVFKLVERGSEARGVTVERGGRVGGGGVGGGFGGWQGRRPRSRLQCQASLASRRRSRRRCDAASTTMRVVAGERAEGRERVRSERMRGGARESEEGCCRCKRGGLGGKEGQRGRRDSEGGEGRERRGGKSGGRV